MLGTRYIVGVDVGRSRHDAMTLAEAGADYIAFGIPPHVEDRAASAARRLELVAWWSEIFEIPCVAFDVDTADDATALAGAGADFVAMRLTSKLRLSAGVAQAVNSTRRRRTASAMAWHERASLARLLLAGSARSRWRIPRRAETSSWVMETTEAPKPKRGKPVKLAPAPSAAI